MSQLSLAVRPDVDIDDAILRPVNRTRVGELLLKQTDLTRDELTSALMLQKHASKPLGEILIARANVSEKMLAHALSTQWGIPVLASAGCTSVVSADNVEFCLKNRCCPVSNPLGQATIVTSDPKLLSTQLAALPADWKCLPRAICTSSEMDGFLTSGGRKVLKDRAEQRAPKPMSCRAWAKPLGRPLLLASAVLLAELVYLFPFAAIWCLFVWTLLTLATTSMLRLLALSLRVRELLGWQPEKQKPADLLQLRPKPMVSILVPLHREEAILPFLIERLANTDYPPELIEFCLIVEQNDFKTRSAIRRLNPGPIFRTIVVPDAKLKTKPRAMNYALDFCKGSIVGIYDAEDAPERDQISRIVTHFANAADDVACVQAYLDFYNPKQNWLARCFTIEYAIWFRVVLHGIERLKLPVPLGGTSVFFRREALEKIGAWDAYNVTEDADLGMRLARFGYRCSFEPSTTFEEANCHPRAWVKQRSRWLKGYIMTWITHMRHPIQLWRDLGAKGFMTFNILLLGTLSTFMSAPAIWSFWLFSFGSTPGFVGYLPWQAWTTLGAAFVGSEILLFLLGIAATWSKSHRFLMPYVPTMMLYWPLGSIAVFKALYEVLLAPFYWDKTVHGHSNPPLKSNKTL